MGSPAKTILKPITNLFDPPKPPKIRPIIQRVAQAAPPPVSKVASRAASPVQQAAEKIVRPRRTGRGRAATIIAALEDRIPEGAVSRKSLLGGN